MHVKRSRHIKSERKKIFKKKKMQNAEKILKVRCTLRLNIAFGEIKYFLWCFLGNIYFLNIFFVDFAFLILHIYWWCVYVIFNTLCCAYNNVTLRKWILFNFLLCYPECQCNKSFGNWSPTQELYGLFRSRLAFNRDSLSKNILQ